MLRLFPNGLEISPRDEKILKAQLINIEQWILSALEGKIDHCKCELVINNRPFIENDDSIDSIPKDKEKLIDMIFSKPYYKDRKRRDQERKEQENCSFKEI